MTAIAIRIADTALDFRNLYDVLVEYEADLPAELRHGCIPDAETLASEYAGSNAMFLAVHDDEAIGCVALKKFDERTAVILRLYVKPQRRGLGAARSLVTSAIDFARNRGYKRIVLDTHKEQLRAAYRLYRSLGFEDCAPYDAVAYRCPTFMELRLED